MDASSSHRAWRVAVRIGLVLGFLGSLLVAVAGPASAVTDYPVTTTADSGAGSLRQAITDANANPGGDTISFDIGPDGSTQTIALDDPLPQISSPVSIDATTQPGYAGSPLIVLDGTGAQDGDAIQLFVSNSAVKGLVISNFGSTANGIFVIGDNNVIQGNYIGTNAAGTAAAPNRRAIILFGSSDTLVGGTTAAQRNVISGNANWAIEVSPNTSDDNVIKGNYIGTNAAGTAAVPNQFDAIVMSGATDTQIGGSAAGEGNVISGNVGTGIEQHGSTDGTLILGNKIGTDAAGTADLGNGMFGIDIGDTTTGSMIGGPGAGEGNTVAFNDLGGVAIESGSTGNQVRGNALYSNNIANLDVEDAPASPTIDLVLAAGSDLYLQGALDSDPTGTFDIDVFTSIGCAEARNFAGTFPAFTNGSGDATIDTGVPSGTAILDNVTTTSSRTDTSNLSTCTPVTPASRVTVADLSFTPSSPTIDAGEGILWDYNGPSQHTATDDTGMGLYDSGQRSADSFFGYAFDGSGTYAFQCTVHPQMQGSASVRLVDVVKVGKKMEVTWASAAPEAGFGEDVQVKVPGSKRWKTWQNDSTATDGLYAPKAGKGTYRFRARLQEIGGSASGYSPAASIKR